MTTPAAQWVPHFPSLDSRSPSPPDLGMDAIYAMNDAKQTFNYEHTIEDERLTNDIYIHFQTLMMMKNKIQTGIEAGKLYNLMLNDVTNCSITQRPVKNPLLDPTSGTSYEKAAIERWVSDRSETSPVTRQRLTIADLRPNIMLRDVVQRMHQVTYSMIQAIRHIGRFIRHDRQNNKDEQKLGIEWDHKMNISPVSTSSNEVDFKEGPKGQETTRFETEVKTNHKNLLKTMLYGTSCSVLLRADLIRSLQTAMDTCCSLPSHSMLQNIKRVFDMHIGATEAYTVVWKREDVEVESMDDTKTQERTLVTNLRLTLRRRRFEDSTAFTKGRIVLYLMGECLRIDMSMDQFCRLCGLRFGHIYGAQPGKNDYLRNPAIAAEEFGSMSNSPCGSIDTQTTHACMDTKHSRTMFDRKQMHRRDTLCGCKCSDTLPPGRMRYALPGLSGCIQTRYNDYQMFAPCLTARVIPATQMSTAMWFRNPTFDRNCNSPTPQTSSPKTMETLRHLLSEADTEPFVEMRVRKNQENDISHA